MALTRKFLSALGIEAEKIDEIINAHTEVTDALKDELAKAKEDAGKLPAVQTELDELKKAVEKDGKDPYKVKYEALKEDFEQYKNDVQAEKTKAVKSSAYEALLKQAGIAEKRIAAVLRVSDIDGVELDKDGKIKDSDKLLDSIKTDWADFIQTDDGKPKGGARVDLGGALGNQSKTMTVDEIMAIEDDAARQEAIAENHTLFGF
jgi:plasmid maintenance system antidote protein VapI